MRAPAGYTPPAVIETPSLGVLHPDHAGYFATPAEYMKWYAKSGKLRGTDAPVVGVLLYRKHVITEQPYIPALVAQLEEQVRPMTHGSRGGRRLHGSQHGIQPS